ncbi:MAG: phosphate ABC transporter permease PstA [Alphaproteobacteria bacterium]|nr:phosphate ABC transporter permease PstA [Alphaproteobacteria bacterium]
MTDMSINASLGADGLHTSDAAYKRLKARYAQEARFKAYGLTAIGFAVLSLVFLLWTIVSNGYTAFLQTSIQMEVFIDPARIEGESDAEKRTENALRTADWRGMVNAALAERFPNVPRSDRRFLNDMLSQGAGTQVRDAVMANPSLIGQKHTLWLLAHSNIDMLHKGFIDRDGPPTQRPVNDRQLAFYDEFVKQGTLVARANTRFLVGANSASPELAGMWVAIVGSFWTLLICLALAFPLGVMTAVWLEEFAPRNKWTDMIEVNINNLAAVPSIVFGLLGLAVFLNFFGMPRSSPLSGGIVLALMSLPVMIIAARASLRAVPPSIRQAAIGLGASKLQAITHHVLPLAMPGILTGTILAMAHALGESAPLMLVGMNAFVVDVPTGPLDAATVLPVQVFRWAGQPERGFVEKTSAAIMILLVFLLFMNAIAIYLRKKFERRW